jgi:hypothetical protein
MAKAKKHKKAVTKHKRKGLHQKRTNSFIKTYWPYLPMVGIIGIGLAINFYISKPSSAVLGSHSSIDSSQLLIQTNKLREDRQEKKLQLNADLNKAATQKANDIVKNNYWAHISKDGTTPWQLISATGLSYGEAGENLAYGFSTSSNVISGWMNSTEHRDNLLNKTFTMTGIGVATSDNFMGKGKQTIVVELYASPSNGQSVIAGGQSTTGTFYKSDINNISMSNISQSISRIQVITKGGAPWSLYYGTIIATILGTIFIVKHGKSWHKTLVKSEAFIIKHPMLDSVAVGLIMIDFVLSHSIGTIL